MGRLKVRGPDTREFEIDESALPFWEGRQGHTILGPVEEPGAEKAVEPSTSEPDEAKTSRSARPPKPAAE